MKLAIHGGKPVRDTEIYYGKQYIDEDDIEAVVNVLKSPLITCGPKVEELEKELCIFTGAKYCVVLSNGTAALHASCAAAGIKDGDEVITTPMTFAATSNSVLYMGGEPVFVDIDPETYNIDPNEIKKKITDKTKAVIAVDFTGQAAELDEIREICINNNLLLIEDASHAIGTKYKGRPIGSISDMTTFSFHPVKTITGGEGGAVMTNDKDLAEKLLLFRTHGITRNTQLFENESHGLWYYEQIMQGYNYRLTDFQAALLISQLNKMNTFSARRKEISKRYNKAFANFDLVTLQKEIPESDTTRHLYILNLNLEKLSVTRKEIHDALWTENICCNVHYIPVYYQPFYEKLGYKKGLCPQAEKLYERILSIPFYYSMTDEDVESIIEGVYKVVGYYRK